MDTEDSSGNLGFQHRGGDSSSESIFKAPNGVDPFYGSGWDQLVSLNPSGNFGGASVGPHIELVNSHYSVALQNQAIDVPSNMAHYPCDKGLSDMVPKIPSFGSGSFSEMVSSFGFSECGQMAATMSHQSYSHNKDTCNDKALNSQDKCQIAKDGAADGKRKRKASDSHSPFNPNHTNAEGGIQKVSSRESSECSKEQDGKREKIEQEHSGGANMRQKQGGKQGNTSNNGEPPKDSYIHVRAKRGQATNSHSLAERVRRERISERMRLLQELVPGCNKITGKAMMLDEIINYVQSLQQQVEFLSMKLSTVNPEQNIDIQRIFSKEVCQNLALPPGLSTSHAFPGIPQRALGGRIPNITQSYHPLPQTAWDSEFQSLLQMGFDTNPSVSNPGPNGR